MKPELVLLFDGTCGFCTRTVDWVKARDRGGQILAIANQMEGILEKYGLTREQADRDALVIEPSGKVLSGAAAVNRVWRALGGGWKALGALYLIPPIGRLEDVIYRLVASNRSLLSWLWGTTPPCESGDCGG